MKTLLLITLLTVAASIAVAQTHHMHTSAADKHSGKVYDFVERMPAFPGDLISFLHDNLQYPALSADESCYEKAVIGFIVRKDGIVTDVSILRSSGCAQMDSEYVRVVRRMPKWNPGSQQGTPVDVYFRLPIVIHLD